MKQFRCNKRQQRAAECYDFVNKNSKKISQAALHRLLHSAKDVLVTARFELEQTVVIHLFIRYFLSFRRRVINRICVNLQMVASSKFSEWSSLLPTTWWMIVVSNSPDPSDDDEDEMSTKWFFPSRYNLNFPPNTPLTFLPSFRCNKNLSSLIRVKRDSLWDRSRVRF